MNGWIKCTGMYGWLGEWKKGLGGWINGWMDEQTNVRMDRWMVECIVQMDLISLGIDQSGKEEWFISESLRNVGRWTL